MIWRIIKGFLAGASVDLSFKEGDLLTIRIMWHNHVIFDRTIDLIKGA